MRTWPGLLDEFEARGFRVSLVHARDLPRTNGCLPGCFTRIRMAIGSPAKSRLAAILKEVMDNRSLRPCSTGDGANKAGRLPTRHC